MSGWGWRESRRRGYTYVPYTSNLHQRGHDDLRFFLLAGASCDCIPNNVLKAAVGVVEVQI